MATKSVVKKRSFNVWLELEECIEYEDGDEQFINREGEVLKFGRFDTEEEAIKAMEAAEYQHGI